MSSKQISDLHPDLQPLCQQLLDQCAGLVSPIDARILYTYRSPEEQNALYAEGRTAPGCCVTMLKGNTSKHCFEIDGSPAAKAFDIGIFKDGKYLTDGSAPEYQQAGEMGEALGLTWGGRWKKPFDPGHFEIA